MEAAKRKLLEQTHQTILKVGFVDNDYELVADLCSTNFVAFGTALDEKIFGIKDLKALLKRQKEQSKGIDINFEINTLHTHLSANENTAVYIDEGVLSIKTDGERIDMILRLSLVLEYIEDKWLMVHFHSSKPEEVESEKDTWGIETWKEKAEELEKEVAQRTADLVLKNRDLAIEAALERVRAKSMAMQSSDGLHDVLSVLFRQFDNLGIQPVNVFLSLFDREERILTYRASGKSGKRTPTKQNVAIDSMEAWSALYDKWIKDSSDAIEVIYYPKEVVPNILSLFKETFLAMPEEERITAKDFPKGGHSTLGYTPFGYLGYDHSRPPTEEEKDILKRICIEFGRVYQRFLDIQKAEAQAREAQIEASLERVRSRAMAIYTSAELDEVIQIIFQELGKLDINLMECSIATYASNPKDLIFTSAGPIGASQPNSIKLQYVDHPILNELLKDLKTGVKYRSGKFSGKLLKTWWELIFTETDFKNSPIEFIESWKKVKSVFYSQFAISHGFLEFLGDSPLAVDKVLILKRFTNVIDLTYRRYDDVLKAEAQAREAQIETALERVRSRSMAMHKSEELKDVVKVIFDQMSHLKINAEHAGIVVDFEPKKDFNFWVADHQDIPAKITVPYLDLVWDKQFTEAKKQGKDFFTTQLDFDAKNRFYKKLLPHIEGLTEQAQDFYLNCAGLAASTVIQKDIGLYIENFSGLAFSDEENNILRRFGKVFQQAHTRFLDLKKSEAQTREAQIEVALERVRARAMAMHKTDELTDVLCVLFDQFDLLGINPVLTHLTLMDQENETFQLRITTSAENRIVANQYIDINAVDAWKNSFENWKNSEPNTIDCIDYTPEQIPVVFQLLKEVMDALPEGHKIYPEDFPEGLFTTQGHFKFGYIGFNHTRRATVEEKTIVERFAKEFGRTYQRFLDLEKAEAQAREAQIEAALEKIRSRSLAMNKSEELREVVLEIHNKFKELDISMASRVAVIVVFEEGSKIFNQWVASHDFSNMRISTPYFKHRVLDDFWRAKEEGAIFYSQAYSEDEKNSYFQTFFEISNYNRTEENEAQAQWIYTQKFYTYSPALQKNSSIGIADFSGIPLTDGEIEIIKRFSKVFEQAYIRFLDLQKSEAQSKETKIEMALEKVRSRTMAMQKSNELAETSVIVFKQLLELGISPNRLFIGIIKNNSNQIKCWATNEDGSKLANEFIADASKNNAIKKMLNGWKQHRRSLTLDLKGTELKDYFKYLSTEMNIPFIHGLEQKRRVQTVAYFSGGLIGMASPEDQPLETIQLLERFAAVFNLTYTRFNDLKIAEANAEKAEHDLIQLQAAKKRAEAALSELQMTQKQLIQSEKMASLGELTAGIAHEIQNPLNFVNNFSEVSKELLEEMLEELEAGAMDEVKAIMADVIHNLEKINHHGKRADGIVKGMLEHSRASGDKKEPTPINVLADEYLRLAYHGLRAKDKSFNAQLVTDFDDSIIKVNVIPQDLGRVILNLLTNAFYVVNEKKKSGIKNYDPTVTIGTKKKKNSIEIKVRDNGSGIPEQVRDKIFQPFFTTKPTGQGTGLGLSMSYDIVTKGHGGKLTVESQEGEGTTFSIILPIKPH